MSENMSQDPAEVLRSAKNVLLVDWPDQRVPRTLLAAGYNVFGYSPGGYSTAAIAEELSEGQNGFPPRDGETGFLVFERLEGKLSTIDLVCVYRPEAEHAAIIEKQVLPFGAKILWLQAPIASVATAELAGGKGLIFIENTDIAAIGLSIK